MKYIVNSIIELIVNNAPSNDGEMMIRVDGFEDVKIYETLSRKLKEEFAGGNLSVDIKLAKNKWKYFTKNSDESSVLQSLEQHGWIAKAESITYYRNLHKFNILVLMGTEDEEDKGGLLNCYTITPDTLVKALGGRYHEVFSEVIEFFSDIEFTNIDKLYNDLFEFVAVDLCKLSDMADSWKDKITNINDFIEMFYGSLPEWGLPYKRLDLPSAKELNNKSNILRTEYNFVSRQMFKKLTMPQYRKYQSQLRYYNEQGEEYCENWDGWSSQSIKTYAEFSDIVMGYIRGEHISAYKEKLSFTDFSIVEAVLDMDLPKGSKPPKKTVPTLTGEPLEVFTNALFYIFSNIKAENVEIERISFDIVQAEIVCMYSNVEEEEEKQQLQNTWNTVCRHTNGVVEYLNRRIWEINGTEVELECIPENIFSPKCAVTYIDCGIVKTANSNKTISKINFIAKCYTMDGNYVKEPSQEFQWKFEGTSAWLHNFSDLCVQELCETEDVNYIPVATISNINSLLFAKSGEEFFDLFDESDINFDFNLSEYIDNKSTGNAIEYSVRFDKLGYSFAKFAYAIANNGFYSCIVKDDSELFALVREYGELGNYLTKKTLPENLKWILDAFIHAFNIEASSNVIENDADAKCCIVPAWHPAALEKLNDQKIFFLDGCEEWWKEQENNDKITKKDIEDTINNLMQMSMIQCSLDIFPTYGQQYFGAVNSFGAFSLYGRSDIENNNRLKDMIHKDAIFDDDFDNKEIAQMNDNAKMIYGIIQDYSKAFPDSYSNLSVVFVDSSELQPIIAAIYKYIEVVRKKYPTVVINIYLKILVKPENKGGRNYLAYWMDEFFSQDANVNIRTYLNEWRTKYDLDKLLNGNNDIVFVMDLLKVNNLQFIKESGTIKFDSSQCRFPIVFKPSPVSDTTVKRRIELSQPQFNAAYAHTQVVRFRNNLEILPDGKYIAVREVCIDSEAQGIVYLLHDKAYWVVCVDSGMDGALLRNDEQHKDDYSIIGFSTGKGAYGQYNLTITARKTILDKIKKKLENRLYQLFHWEKAKIDKAAALCLSEASGLDGISLLSAINPKDHNINEFMAYIFTSLREKSQKKQSALKIVIHLDSYKHWFNGEIEKDEDESLSRPDFLVLEANLSHDDKMMLKATVIECKISSEAYLGKHKEKAVGQVKHGIRRLSTIFDPSSKSIKRRYWYAQLYRALAFAQVTFSDNTTEFAKLSSKLRSVLDGNFEIEWNGKVLGFWMDMDGTEENTIVTDEECIKSYDIPQLYIQKLLLNNTDAEVVFVNIDAGFMIDEENQNEQIAKREMEIEKEIQNLQKGKKRINPVEIKVTKTVEPRDVENVSDDIEAHDSTGDEDRVNVTKQEEDTKTDVEETDNKLDVSQKNDDLAQRQDNNTNNNKENNTDLDETRVLIGTDKTSEKVYWEFGNKQLANRHMLITGTSGQGKTYSIQTMLYELSKSSVSSAIFDYTEGFRLDQLEQNFVSKMGNKIVQHIVYHTGVPINPFKRHEIEVAGMTIFEKTADVAARIANIFMHVYGFGDQQFSAIFEAARVGLDKYGNNMNMQHFQDELEDVKSRNPAAKTVLSKMTPFFYSIEFKTDVEFDWSKILYSNESMINIFQLTLIDREMQVIITELMLWDAWYFTKKYGSKDKPFVVVLDEAQNLSHKSNSPSAAILTEGRKFGWSAWFATQSLKVLSDDEVVRLLQAAYKLYFKPTDDEVIKMARQLDPADGSTWISSLKSLKKGQCIVVGERIRQDGKFGLVKPTITNVSSFVERS